jgi:hypothetical protein
MRRIAFALVASALLVAFAPAGALAKSHRHHSRTHHARIRRFGDMSPTAPTTTTGAPAPVGTITSFDGTTLIVHFNDGNTVTGVVTNDTQIECTSSSQSTGSDDQGDQSGTTSGSDDQSDQSGTTSGSDDQSDQSGTTSGSDDQSDQSGTSGQTTGSDDQSDDQGDENGSSSSCGPSSLQPNANVLGAEVRFGATTTWEKIQLG